ncbi:hypothetical protein [Microbulbifer halophilus]|uniref:Uncharacterized protein n=1 Tax=Microbulbifer halophilus TaxID=453963 RepID=A0ABW5EBH4_9GAMM|nr:hypothetical protein [Microbulbifer halophilus]MCW8125723.1 hypothetical protein [Microbulbifer halophilus]
MGNHHWLMNSEVLTILRKLRKRLNAEFGIVLRFSDYDFEQQLARARDRTVDGETRRMIAALETRKGESFRTGEEQPPRLYRGQPILEEDDSKRDIYERLYGDELAEHDPSRRPTPTKIYRGSRSR